MASPHSMMFRRLNCYLGSGTAAVLADVPGYRPGELPWDAKVALRGHMAFTKAVAPAVIWGWKVVAGERFGAVLADTFTIMEEKVAAACAPPVPFSMKTRSPTPEEEEAILRAVERKFGG